MFSKVCLLRLEILLFEVLALFFGIHNYCIDIESARQDVNLIVKHCIQSNS